MNKIHCQKCGCEIEIDNAIKSQIETDLAETHKKEIAEAVDNARKSMEKSLQARLKSEKETLRNQNELKREQLIAEAKLAADREIQKARLSLEKTRNEADIAKEANAELLEDLKKTKASLLKAQNDKDSAETELMWKLADETKNIREEERKKAEEAHQLKELELQKQLDDTKKALDSAKKKAEQGSQQLQGEVLELELERFLREEFTQDKIEEVKKGQRGADIKQYVRNGREEECGLILWEAKNAKWSKEWILKIKSDIREAEANIGILVSQELPDTYQNMSCVDGSNIWVVKPALANALASALRITLIQVYSVTRSNENRAEKMDFLYQYLMGVKFKNRISAMVENYTALQQELEKEKRASEIRWAKQETAIRMVLANANGLYGDLQGITNNELQIPLLEMVSE